MRISSLVFILFFCSTLALHGQSDTTAQGSLAVEIDSNTAQNLRLYQEFSKKFPYINGYRIQVFNGKKDDCLAKRGEFLKLYPDIPVYLLYEVPEYRIQVGDYRQRLEAEGFLQQLKEVFPGSFVVKTSISYPKLKGS